MQLNPCRVTTPDVFLELGAEPTYLVCKMACAGIYATRSPELYSETAQVISLCASVIESREVDVFSSNPIIIGSRSPVQLRQKCFDVNPHLFAEVLADDARTVSDSVREDV